MPSEEEVWFDLYISYNTTAGSWSTSPLINNAIIAESTGAGQYGVETATVCARFGLQYIIYMGAQDMERQSLNVFRMRLLGAETLQLISQHMVREFHVVIGKETRKHALEKWGGKPDVLVACVGGGSNAMGLFHEFVNDKDIRLIGVEAAGHGTYAATLTKGEVGVLHGAMSYLLQDEDDQIVEPHSISAG
ncbi:hypothetical protein EZV62_009177 [Acer yangbiense]|uniref:Uncharacterized protein n=1 Tax=Acer yangbiense TaxID=1000413 RepID=A0A5C7IGB6_9ROSI|nr:hypothetical protein EZV62_009177 [Acer yangbiense]